MGRPLKRLWPALEALPGLAAIAEEWKQRLGEDFEAGQDLLRVTNRRAEAYPCPSPGGIGCVRGIVDQGNGKFVAVCGDQPKRCDRLLLTKQDIAVHELDARKLCTAIATAFGIDQAFDEVTGLQQTYRVGDYQPLAGKRFPLFLSIPTDPVSFRDVVSRFCTSIATAFVLVVPTTRFSDLAIMDLLGRQKARLTALADLFEIDGVGKLVATEAAGTLLAEFRAAVLPADESKTGMRFPTPAGAAWGDVVFEFRGAAEGVVNVQCKKTDRRVEPEHLKMKSLKNGKPTNQWVLLQSFARCNGIITWKDKDSSDSIKQQKRQLSAKLIGYFGIEGDPIFWDQSERGYRTRFTIRWVSPPAKF